VKAARRKDEPRVGARRKKSPETPAKSRWPNTGKGTKYPAASVRPSPSSEGKRERDQTPSSREKGRSYGEAKK